MPSETALVIAPADLRRIEEEALVAWPEEGCGVLVGERVPGEGVLVRRVVATPNAYDGDRGRRFAIAPRVLLEVHKKAREAGLEVVGYWHSHPEGGARPSERDRQAAWPGDRHLIVALADRRIVERRCWRLLDEGEGFAEEEIRYSPETEDDSHAGEPGR